MPFPIRRAMAPAALGTIALVAGFVSAKPARTPHDAANAFLATLTPEQKALASFPFADDEQSKWKFVPGDDRKGFPMWDMGADQQAAALDLLATCMSAEGVQRSNTIREMENVLLQIENANPRYRNAKKYYVSIFGQPSRDGLWGWRFEGHHQSLHWTLKGDRIVASTPQFFGTNPARIPAGLPLAGTEVLRSEQELGRAMVLGLDPERRAKAVVETVAPPDILTGDRRRIEALDDFGVRWSELAPDQRKRLMAVIDAHTAAMPKAEARRRVDAMRKAGMDAVRFAWMGSTEPGKGHYYRVQGPTFVIEYDNTQNNANHVHDVWRDFEGDFGRGSARSAAGSYGPDVLARHYAAEH
ncbi:MAG: DUF3500 domain-containing protein [Armatimonadota bacterium]